MAGCILAKFSPFLRVPSERVHVHNERNFPKAKLDSEINVVLVLSSYRLLEVLC